LTQLVEQFPDFVNGLVFYGKFAYQSSKIKQPEDLLTLAVRKLGFRSIKMQEIDSMPLIPVSDALHRMDNFLDKYATSENKDKIQYYELMVERQKLLWLYENKYENSEKNIDMWYLLEKCTGNNEIYPEYLAKYATWLFIFSQRFEDAQNLLNTHLQNKSTKGNFDTMLLWEKEYEAFLQGKLHKNYEAAFEIYENLTTDKMSVQALQNYANICEAKFFYDKALRLYGMAQEKSNDSKEKSDIHYKIANVQIAKGSFDDAILSLNYSINLNPGNTKSRLILKKISK
jgi:tetratricopeptide (TPR) repeat protein